MAAGGPRAKAGESGPQSPNAVSFISRLIKGDFEAGRARTDLDGLGAVAALEAVRVAPVPLRREQRLPRL